MSDSPPPPPPSLRERNRQRVREQLIEAAVALVSAQGFAATTVDAIAAAAGVGRATFFRYFESKDAAVVVGFYEYRLSRLVEILHAAPAKLAPFDAVTWAIEQLGAETERQLPFIELQARLLAASPSLHAKALEFQASYENAIADAITGRYRELAPNDLRPRLLAAAVLAMMRIITDYWNDDHRDQNLAQLSRAALEHLGQGFGKVRPPSPPSGGG